MPESEHPTSGDLPVAVVTGASSGIGLSTCVSLHARGFFVVATMRDPTRAAEELRALPNAIVRALDVTDEDSVRALADWMRDDTNGVTRCDVVVNNAGYGVPGSIEIVSIEQAKRVYDVNVWGVARMCQAFLPLMRQRGRGGLVVLVSSTSGVRGLACTDVYASSKFAAEGMMESLRYSLARDNIKVAICSPGPVQTPFITRYKSELTSADTSDNIYARAMTAASMDVLSQRLQDGQTQEGCANGIADTVDREYRKVVNLETADTVRFRNGTSEYAETVIGQIMVDPAAATAQPYSDAWDAARDLSRRAEDALRQAEEGGR